MSLSRRRWERQRPERAQPLFDAAPPASPSQQAARSIAHAVAYIESRILAHLAQCPDGATTEELCAALDLRMSTGSARCSELRRLGRIIDSGRTRPTSSGRAAAVWLHPDSTHGGSDGCSPSAA